MWTANEENRGDDDGSSELAIFNGGNYSENSIKASLINRGISTLRNLKHLVLIDSRLTLDEALSFGSLQQLTLVFLKSPVEYPVLPLQGLISFSISGLSNINIMHSLLESLDPLKLKHLAIDTLFDDVLDLVLERFPHLHSFELVERYCVEFWEEPSGKLGDLKRILERMPVLKKVKLKSISAE